MAYDFSETRLDRFFKAFRENSDELARMIEEVDSDYAYEKLRIRAEKNLRLRKENRMKGERMKCIQRKQSAICNGGTTYAAG